ncbi:MAG: S9 family peptidase [Deltaproteobacteria bacterium]|nr:S9 family peptidase [Deltaproteobacteria bacterium]
MSLSRTLATSIASAAVLACLLAAAPAEARKKRVLAVEDLYKMGRVSQLAVSPDEPLAAFVVKTFDMEENKGVSHIWLADLKKRRSRQLTNATSSDWGPRWLTDGRLAFLSVRSGAPQVWAISLDGGEAQQLTDLPTGVDNFAVAPDGAHLAVVSTVFPDCVDMACNAKKLAEKEASKVKARHITKLLYRMWDHWLDERRGHVLWVPIAGGEPKDLTPGDLQTPPHDLGGHMDLSISPDSAEVAFTANLTENPAWNTNNDVLTVPVKGGAPKNITNNNEACDAEPVHSPDGSYIAYLAMKRPGFEADRKVLTLYDRKSHKRIPLTDSLDRSVYEFSWAPDSSTIWFNVSDRGRIAIYKVAVPTGIVTKVVKDAANTNVQPTADGDYLVYIKQTMSVPAEVYKSEVTGANERPVSRINGELMAGIEMGQYEDFEFEGAGGDMVHGFLLKPPGFKKNKKYPLLMLIHGGPQGAFGERFHPRWNMQLFATPGFVVAAVNFHGSRGYGQEFCDAVSGDWGGKPYEDVMKGTDYVLTNYDFIDKKNISAAGASYGGFMINWILGHTDRFRSLVSHDGVYEQWSMYGSTEELWFPEWEFKGTPWDNPELYDKFSPARYADKFQTPTLVIHGENDYRVPYTQGLQLFSALQRQGVESKLLYFPDENHFVQKPQNARLWWNEVLGWLAKYAGIKWKPPGQKSKPRKPGVKQIAGPGR